MKPPSFSGPVLATLVVGMAAALCGCDRNIQGGPTTPVAAKPTPQESFERVISAFRRKIEDQPVGFVMSDGKSRSTMVATLKVSSQLVPPTTPNDNYKAIVSVESQSQYSLRRTKGGDETDRDQAGKNQNKNQSAAQTDSTAFSTSTSDQGSTGASKDASKTDSKSKEPKEEIVTRRPDEQVRKYQLAYEGGRWVLKTALDPKTEKSIQFAFDVALASQ